MCVCVCVCVCELLSFGVCHFFNILITVFLCGQALATFLLSYVLESQYFGVHSLSSAQLSVHVHTNSNHNISVRTTSIGQKETLHRFLSGQAHSDKNILKLKS